MYNFPHEETWRSVLSKATSCCHLAVRTFSFLFPKRRKLSYFGAGAPKEKRLNVNLYIDRTLTFSALFEDITVRTRR